MEGDRNHCHHQTYWEGGQWMLVAPPQHFVHVFTSPAGSPAHFPGSSKHASEGNSFQLFPAWAGFVLVT